LWGIGFDPLNGRDGQIRTADPSHPKRVLYQAEPRPENGNFLIQFTSMAAERRAAKKRFAKKRVALKLVVE
jgi:hypothetical protein